MVKTPIPGTDWVRVITTEGNTFYTHKVRKESVWTVPDEIKDAVAALEQEQAEAKEEEEEEAEEEARKAEEEKEVKRIRSEVQDIVGKRKAEEAVLVDEVVISKKPRVEEDEDEDEDEESEEEEEWQKEAAAQLAAEAEEQRRIQEEQKKLEEEERAKQLAEAEAAQSKPLNMPNRVDLSLDEAKALFKVCFTLPD